MFTTVTGPVCERCGSLLIPDDKCVNGCSLADRIASLRTRLSAKFYAAGCDAIDREIAERARADAAEARAAELEAQVEEWCATQNRTEVAREGAESELTNVRWELATAHGEAASLRRSRDALEHHATEFQREAEAREAAYARDFALLQSYEAEARATIASLRRSLEEARSTLRAIADYEIDWTLGPAANVGYLQTIAEAALATPSPEGKP